MLSLVAGRPSTPARSRDQVIRYCNRMRLCNAALPARSMHIPCLGPNVLSYQPRAPFGPTKRVDKRPQGTLLAWLILHRYRTSCSPFLLDLCSPRPLTVSINPLVPPPHHVGRAAPPDGRGCHRWNSCSTTSLRRTGKQRSHSQDVAIPSSRVCAAELEEPPVHVACMFAPDITSLENS